MHTSTDTTINSLPKPQKLDRSWIVRDDQVADMRDVFDVMQPTEIQERELKTLEWAMRTPALQSKLGYEGWKVMYT